MVVLLLETTPPGTPGSMAAYADLAEAALHAAGGSHGLHIKRLCLPSAKASRPNSGRLRLLQLVMAARLSLPGVNADLVHILDGSLAFVARWLPKSIPMVLTSHDLIPWLQMQRRFPVARPGVAARRVIRKSLEQVQQADRVVAVSARTREDLVGAGCEPQRVSVVPNALRQDFAAACANLPADLAPVPGRPYILHVGNNGFYKNRAGVVRVFARVRQQLPLRLVLAGPPPDDALQGLITALGLEDCLDTVVDPGMGTLAGLYRQASLLLFPSLYEGFGWPPLEAMAAGCPVVCSNTASLPEIVGDAALMAMPEEEDALARLCVNVLGDRSLADSLRTKGLARAAGFTPERMGRKLLEVYSSVLPQLNHSTTQPFNGF